MHTAAYNFVRAARDQNRRSGLVLEIGSRNINGTIRDLFRGEPYLGIDIWPGAGVDALGNGATFHPPTPPATIVCCEVLEHTHDAEGICRNAHAQLAPGGVFIVTAAGFGRRPHSAVDGSEVRPGEFYANVSQVSLEAWLARFDTVEITVDPIAGDIYAVARKAAA